MEVETFWREFADASDVKAPYTAWAFGTEIDREMQTELGTLVRDGPKRATAGVLAEYEIEGEALPQVGDYSVILDGRGEPLCIIQTTRVEVRPFGEVDADFAWTEGEGDRTLEWWREAHIGFYDRVGLAVSDDTLMVLERFDLVWPERQSSS